MVLSVNQFLSASNLLSLSSSIQDVPLIKRSDSAFLNSRNSIHVQSGTGVQTDTVVVNLWSSPNSASN